MSVTHYCAKCGQVAELDSDTDEWVHWNHTPLCPTIGGPAAVTIFRPPYRPDLYRLADDWSDQ